MVDLESAWSVLETEATLAGSSLKSAVTGHQVGGLEIEIAADPSGNRYLLIPLLPGEAVLEDRTGRWVQLVRTVIGDRQYVALRCGATRLARLFQLLAEDILREVEGKPSPSAVAFQALQRWKELFAVASGPLGDEQLIGLLAELLCLERCYRANPAFDLTRWTGPAGGKHDLQNGPVGVEVKATMSREGRVVGIHGIEQLDPSPGADLYLALHRFEPVEPAQGEHLPAVVDRLEVAGAPRGDLLALLGGVGYSELDLDSYSERAFRLVDERLYDVGSVHFPRLTPHSFASGSLPSGILRVNYSIDLTNEPPSPLGAPEVAEVWARVAGGSHGAA